MITLKQKNFNLQQINSSGQCFRMKPIVCNAESGYEIIAGDHLLFAQQEDDLCKFHCSREEFEQFWYSYFDLGTDYKSYIDAIYPDDEYLTNAAACGNGIRILRQDLWEMIITFLISQQNNIVRIRHCIDNICRRYGKEMPTAEGGIYYSFPDPDSLAGATDEDLKACNVGYRSKYIMRTAKSIASGEMNLEDIRRMGYSEAKTELLKLYGVGAKVADCICLFALHRLEAFPVDTHIHQAVEKHYRDGFPAEKYSGFEGVLQQYIFYYELNGLKQSQIDKKLKIEN